MNFQEVTSSVSFYNVSPEGDFSNQNMATGEGGTLVQVPIVETTTESVLFPQRFNLKSISTKVLYPHVWDAITEYSVEPKVEENYVFLLSTAIAEEICSLIWNSQIDKTQLVFQRVYPKSFLFYLKTKKLLMIDHRFRLSFDSKAQVVHVYIDPKKSIFLGKGTYSSCFVSSYFSINLATSPMTFQKRYRVILKDHEPLGWLKREKLDKLIETIRQIPSVKVICSEQVFFCGDHYETGQEWGNTDLCRATKDFHVPMNPDSKKSRYKFFTYPEALRCLLDASQTLQKLHEQGITHRDIKLENIVVKANSKSEFRGYIIDWGFVSKELFSSFYDDSYFAWDSLSCAGLAFPTVDVWGTAVALVELLMPLNSRIELRCALRELKANKTPIDLDFIIKESIRNHIETDSDLRGLKTELLKLVHLSTEEMLEELKKRISKEDPQVMHLLNFYHWTKALYQATQILEKLLVADKKLKQKILGKKDLNELRRLMFEYDWACLRKTSLYGKIPRVFKEKKSNYLQEISNLPGFNLVKLKTCFKSPEKRKEQLEKFDTEFGFMTMATLSGEIEKIYIEYKRGREEALKICKENSEVL